MKSSSRRVRYRFERYGSASHLVIDDANDLKKAVDLDPALWVASSVPAACMNFDSEVLAVVDGNGDGRITHHELITAISWTLDVLKDHSGISEARATIRADQIDETHPDGKAMRRSCGKIIARYSVPDDEISLEILHGIIKEIESRPASGSGVVLPEASSSTTVRELIEAVIRVTGGANHPDGAVGVNADSVENYKKTMSAYHSWKNSAPMTISVIAEASLEERFASVCGKIDQFFALCAWSGVGGGEIHVPAVQVSQSDIALSGSEFILNEVEKRPIADPNEEGVLQVAACKNAVYRLNLASFFDKVLSPVLGKNVTKIDADEWASVRPRLLEIESWLDAKPALADRVAAEEKIDRQNGDAGFSEIEELIAQSKKSALDREYINLLKRLVLFQRHLLTLANNFVSFPHLYSRELRAAFEMGYLVLDGRRFNLAVAVQDRKAHVLQAKNSLMYVFYASVGNGPGEKAYEVAVPVTAGRKGNLWVGKRGIFIDLAGRERNAVITEIIENPISVAEAMVSPFKRLARMITGKIEEITQEAQSQLDSFASGDADAYKVQQAEQGGRRGLSGGSLLVGGSVAFAAIGSAIAYIANTLTKLTWWQFLASIGGVIAMVILPSAVLAFIKLRRRDLSAIIEASGWAVNARMRLTHRLGRCFTLRPDYPSGSKGIPVHRRAARKSLRLKW